MTAGPLWRSFLESISGTTFRKPIDVKLKLHSKIEFPKLKFQKSGPFLYIFKTVVDY